MAADVIEAPLCRQSAGLLAWASTQYRDLIAGFGVMPNSICPGVA
jgi:hypothetical protein